MAAVLDVDLCRRLRTLIWRDDAPFERPLMLLSSVSGAWSPGLLGVKG